MEKTDLSTQTVLRTCADYLLEIQSPEGFFVSRDSKHQEIAIYQIESTWTLLEAYREFKDPNYLEAATRTLDRFTALQKPDGSIPHTPLPQDYYQHAQETVFEYTLAPLKRNGTTYPGSEMDPAEFARMGLTDGGLAIAARSYYVLSGEDRYREMAFQAMDHYLTIWDPDYLKGNHFITHYGLAFALVAFHAWRDAYPEAMEMVQAITQLFTDGPVWWGYSPSKLAIIGTSLLTVHGARYADSHIRPALESLLKSGLEVFPGGYGMSTDSNQHWGSYADIRGTVPLMIIMKAYDRATTSETFTSRPEYHRMLGWLSRNQEAAHNADRPFYEVQRADGSWFGSGTPVFLTVWWAMGRFAALYPDPSG